MRPINNYISDQLNEGLIDWVKNYFAKSANFFKTWIEKGGSSVDVDSKGNLQESQKPIDTTFNDFKKIFPKEYDGLYPGTTKYVNNEQKKIKPDSVDQNKWENITLKFFMYTPKHPYDGEHYPVALILQGHKKLELIEGYKHIHYFEYSTKPTFNGLNNNQVFELYIDDLKKKFPNAKGVTMTNNPLIKIKRFSYKGKKFETSDIDGIAKLEF